MRDIKDLKNVEDITSTWLVIETWHERYSFSTVVHTYVNEKLSEVAADLGWKLSDLEYCNIYDTHCKVDITEAAAFDGYESFGTEDLEIKEHIQPIHIESYLILNMNEDWEGEYVWGRTNKKFGLLDLKEV